MSDNDSMIIEVLKGDEQIVRLSCNNRRLVWTKSSGWNVYTLDSHFDNIGTICQTKDLSEAIRALTLGVAQNAKG